MQHILSSDCFDTQRLIESRDCAATAVGDGHHRLAYSTKQAVTTGGAEYTCMPKPLAQQNQNVPVAAAAAAAAEAAFPAADAAAAAAELASSCRPACPA